MNLSVGNVLPDGVLWEIAQKGDRPKPMSVLREVQGKRIVVFGLPGAFTPTCSANHLPGYVNKADEILEFTDEIWCLSVNDAFVMHAWGEKNRALGRIRMLGDGSAIYTTLLSLELDLSEKGLGLRMQRFSMLVDDGLIKNLNVELAGKFEVSSAEVMLEQLRAN